MQVVFHLGAHSTDEERLVRGLGRARGTLGAQGCQVPQPARYRRLLSDALGTLRGAPAESGMQEALLDQIVDEDAFDRLVLSHEFFLCIPHKVISEGGFYRMAGRKAAGLANLFAGQEIEFHMALRDPATLLPALMERIDGKSYDDYMGEVRPEDLRWLPVIEDIRSSVPEARLVLWCNEDTPLIWPEVLRGVAGVGPEMPLEAEMDVLATIMTEGGIERLAAYLAERPGIGTDQRRKVTTAFLSKFADPGQLEVEAALPGWDQALVDRISAAYEADVAAIAALPGVEFLHP